MEKIGMDVHRVSMQIWVLTETGQYQEQRIRTGRDSLSDCFGGRPPACILLEAATGSEWRGDLTGRC